MSRRHPEPGLGAIVHPQGTSFRVWAPHARQVWLKGDFNGWKDDDLRLVAEDNGHWALDVPTARAGQGYLFRLEGADGNRFDRVDPCARQVQHSNGHGIIVDPQAFDWQDVAFEPPPPSRLVIYELHLGTFGVEPGSDAVGTFEGAIRRLPHLKTLGVTAVQLMPVAEFAGDRSWGYNPAHPYAVETAYGGPEGLRTFVREAHRHGLAVILDVVYNHFGPSDLNLWRFDGWHENEGGGIYFYNDNRAQTPWGETRPDYGRGEVRQYIRDNALMWLREYRLDGLRLDMTLYMRSIGGGHGDELPDGWSLMQWITDEVRREFPKAFTISEDLRQWPALTARTSDGGAGFHAQWDARFVHPVRQALIAPDDAHRSMAAVCDSIVARDHGDAFNRVIYTESHDEVANGSARVPYEIDLEQPDSAPARRRAAQGLALVLTAPGVPMLFQGQEWLQAGWFRDDEPINWDSPRARPGFGRLVRDLVALRTGRTPGAAGLAGQGVHVFHANESANVIAFRRWDQGGEGDDVVVLVNLAHADLADYRIGLPAGGRWRVRFNSDSRAYGPVGEDRGPAEVWASPDGYDGLPASASVLLPGYAVLLLTQAPGDASAQAPALA